MKRQSLLAWSMSMNVALAAVLAVMVVHRVGYGISPNPAVVPATLASPVSASMPSARPVPSAPDGWRSWLGSLRGVPDNVVAGLVAADFEIRWQKQRRDLQRRYARGDVDDAALNRFMQDHDADREEELRFALGADGFQQWDKERVLADLDVDRIELSGAEADALYRLKKEFAREEHDLAEAHQNGEVDEMELDGRERDAENDYERRLKLLLGDARYASFKNPGDAAQGEMMRALKKLNATDAQVQAMASAQEQWSRQRNELERQVRGTPDETAAYDRQLRVINETRDAEYLRILGAEGVAQLRETEDGRYRAMQHYAAAWRLSPDDIDHVYRTLQQSETSVRDYQWRAHNLESAGQSVDWPAVDADVQRFSEQTWQNLNAYLGDARFDRLKKNSILGP
ncbi:MAG TPA: hypothetical protein VN625_04025 [Desulfuromonadaceae bacterium]|nr:hypothetical protein [Desulfuromonadaceae bacterium]